VKKVGDQNILKGQCPEINNFFEGPKNEISTFCISAESLKKNFSAFEKADNHPSAYYRKVKP
jgi:hypothetical protein